LPHYPVFALAIMCLILSSAGFSGCAAEDSGDSSTETSTSAVSTASPSQQAPTPAPTGATVSIECYPGDHVFTITDLQSPQAELAQIWPEEYIECDATRTAGPLTRLERKALAASRYSRDDIDYLYEFCAANDPDDPYVTEKLREQIPELRGWLIMCPKHPAAKSWRAALRRGKKKS
jgi:hypothetical protein